MTIYEFGDVVLVPFPFTNQTGEKKRPAVVVSSTNYNNSKPDLLLMAITSQIKKPFSLGEIGIVAWEKAGLIKPSMIKPVMTTVERTLILKKLGQLEIQDKNALRDILQVIIG